MFQNRNIKYGDAPISKSYQIETNIQGQSTKRNHRIYLLRNEKAIHFYCPLFNALNIKVTDKKRGHFFHNCNNPYDQHFFVKIFDDPFLYR